MTSLCPARLHEVTLPESTRSGRDVLAVGGRFHLPAEEPRSRGAGRRAHTHSGADEEELMLIQRTWDQDQLS